jgi:RNA polymerase sigma-70 factor (ECF subfamily)
MLFARNSRALYQTALRLLGNPEDAEDALQEGMLAAYRNLRHFEGRSQFSTWLTRIVINAALMRRRRRRTHTAVSLDECDREEQVPAVERFPDDGPSPEEIYAAYELSERLRPAPIGRAVERLPWRAGPSFSPNPASIRRSGSGHCRGG